MSEIILEKRYPHSRSEDIIDAFMRGYVKGKTDRPQGEWKHLKGDEWLCSNCGYVVRTEGSWEHPLEIGKDYCEHCGADMRGEEQ